MIQEGEGQIRTSKNDPAFRAAGWQRCQVEDTAASIRNALVGGPFGSNLVSKDYTAAGIPVIRGQNMGSGRWIDGEFAYVSAEKAAELAANRGTLLVVIGCLVLIRGKVVSFGAEPSSAWNVGS